MRSAKTRVGGTIEFLKRGAKLLVPFFLMFYTSFSFDTKHKLLLKCINPYLFFAVCNL